MPRQPAMGLGKPEPRPIVATNSGDYLDAAESICRSILRRQLLTTCNSGLSGSAGKAAGGGQEAFEPLPVALHHESVGPIGKQPAADLAASVGAPARD